MSDMRIATQPISISNPPQAKNDLELRSLRNASKTGSAAKIDKAAHDFESILVGQWLEKAEKSFATVPGADPDPSRTAARAEFLHQLPTCAKYQRTESGCAGSSASSKAWPINKKHPIRKLLN